MVDIRIFPFDTVDFATLRISIDFVQRSVEVYGKTYPQPRLTRWYGPVPYTYSRLTWEPCPMPPLVDELRSRVEAMVGKPFNSVLCNLYRDGNDCVGWHADDEPVFGGDPVVASLSFGSSRIFKVRHKSDHAKKYEFLLHDGTLLVMGRGVQPNYQHTIPKAKGAFGERINLTFRNALT